MPTEREREYYSMGYRDGYRAGKDEGMEYISSGKKYTPMPGSNPKRKLSPWNKFVKANSKKPRFRYKSGAKRGKVNLKALGVAYRKKKRR